MKRKHILYIFPLRRVYKIFYTKLKRDNNVKEQRRPCVYIRKKINKKRTLLSIFSIHFIQGEKN